MEPLRSITKEELVRQLNELPAGTEITFSSVPEPSLTIFRFTRRGDNHVDIELRDDEMTY